jgi:hypothetical protein
VLKTKLQQVFLLTMLTLGSMFAPSIDVVEDADAAVFISRACIAPVSVLESMTLSYANDPTWRWVSSAHLDFNSFFRTWNLLHWTKTGWQNGWRVYTGHWPESFPNPGTVGYHYYWDNLRSVYFREAITQSVFNCISQTL